MSFTGKKILHGNGAILTKQTGIALVWLLTGVFFFVALKDLFFFDEDIFVTNTGGPFMHNMWQRSYIVKLTFAADNLLWGTNPSGYHITNLIFHLLDAILAMAVFKALLKLLPLNEEQQLINFSPPVFLILFLVTPIHSEPLCYILARGGSVVCFFCLLSLLFFIKANFKNRVLFSLSLLSFVTALFCYEISWLMPLIVLSVTVFIFYCRQEPVKSKLYFVLPFFVVFAAWFIIKVVVLDKMEVSDYNDSNLLSNHFITLVKNSIVLFLRNFIPPFKSTLVFLTVSISFCVLMCLGFFKLFKKNRRVFYFALLLLVSTILAFAPVSVIGIDSHDSESERYIYFSSAFALMLLSTILTTIINNKRLLAAVVLTIGCYYAYTTFVSIGYYKKASKFSRSYLGFIDLHVKENTTTVFLVNQPSQYEGALLFRAKSKIEGNTNDSVGIMQEYLSYLYNKKVNCITLSKSELMYASVVDGALSTTMAKVRDKFPEIILDTLQTKIGIRPGQMYRYDAANTLLVIFDRGTLYFFR